MGHNDRTMKLQYYFDYFELDRGKILEAQKSGNIKLITDNINESYKKNLAV
jgi:hypothetical protein